MIISRDTILFAEAAIRDILFMFEDMVSSDGGFGHNIDSGLFPPFQFLEVVLDEPPGRSFGLDVDLVRTGAAVAILCNLADSWDELRDWEGDFEPDLVERIRAALASGVLTDHPRLREALEAGCEDGERFRTLLPGVSETYVKGYFASRAR